MKTSFGRKTAQVVAALVMAGAAWSMATGLSTPIAQAAAQKVTLTRLNRDCSGAVVSGGSNQGPFGFATINTTGSGKLVGNVVLRGGTPNATYNVRLIQTPNTGPDAGGECAHVDGTLTTDAFGNGSTNVQEPLQSGTEDAFVVLNNQNPALPLDFFTTEEVFF